MQRLERETKESTPVEVRKFSDEAREALTKEGYVIYTLIGQSITDLGESGKEFWRTLYRDVRYEAVEVGKSMHSEVAIKPDAIFIPDSNHKTLVQQKNMIANFSQEFAKKVNGVKAVMGVASDYVCLELAHANATGHRLFEENEARTNTSMIDTDFSYESHNYAVVGSRIVFVNSVAGYDKVFAAPLVVPA